MAIKCKNCIIKLHTFSQKSIFFGFISNVRLYNSENKLSNFKFINFNFNSNLYGIFQTYLLLKTNNQ